jgi:hypothetical protein
MRLSQQQPLNDNRSPIDDVADALEAAVRAASGDSAEFGRFEESALSIANEAVRRVLQRRMQAVADHYPDQVAVACRVYQRHQPGRVTYHSLAGSFTVDRWTYREVGVRNGPTCVPIDLALGIVARTTPALAYAVAQGYAKGSTRELERDLHAARREPPSRSTLERLAAVIGGELRRRAPELEHEVRTHEAVPGAAAAVVVGLDRTSIPMEEDGPNGVEVHYRMAFVGTVAINDSSGTVLITRKYAAPAHEGASSVVNRMMDDLRCILFRRPELHFAIVQDGAQDLWWHVRDAAKLNGLKTPIEIVDRYHLMQHLSAALDAIERDESRRAAILHRWAKSLNRSDRAIDRIKAWIHRHTGYGAAHWSAVDRAVGMYLINPRYFRYASLPQYGVHMGSGVTEGACKSLIMQRAKRSGQRWRPVGISNALQLRSLLESDRLPDVWKRFARSFRDDVRAAA